MNYLLKLEELFLFFFSILLFSLLHFEWWLYPALLILPDIGMLGYLFGSKAGAISYNLFHHKGVSVGMYIFGVYSGSEVLQLTALILFGHSSMDRFFGYGLKHFQSFKDTHLGVIGK